MFDGKSDKIYCQGVKGAYSHIACKKIFGDDNPVFVRTFEEVCRNTQEGGMGILPFENSTAGLVNGIIDYLLKYNLNIIYAKTFEIRHNLCAVRGTEIGDIKKIFSHQQALLQCSDFLNKLNAEQIETVNTAASAQMASLQNGSAAVCSEEAAKLYGLEVIKENICNNKINSTRFIVISNQSSYEKNANIISLYFKLKNKIGALYKTLKIFADYGVNLCSLHSIPLENESWHYGFFTDIEGNISDENIGSCIAKLERETEYLKILGCYLSE
jgi:chorismate mutase/prephenate dehydratase